MPTDTAELKRMVKSKYPFVDENLDQVVGIIWNATESSYAFESRAEQLKKERLEQVCLGWSSVYFISYLFAFEDGGERITECDFLCANY